jgi:hypothetical protein
MSLLRGFRTSSEEVDALVVFLRSELLVDLHKCSVGNLVEVGGSFVELSMQEGWHAIFDDIRDCCRSVFFDVLLDCRMKRGFVAVDRLPDVFSRSFELGAANAREGLASAKVRLLEFLP